MIHKLLLPFHKALLKRARVRYEGQPDASAAARLARALIRVGRGDEAYAIITSARKLFPSDPAIKTAYKFVRVRQAKALLTQTMKQLRRDKTPENYIRAADLLRTAGKHQKALSLIAGVDEAFPDHWGIDFALGRLYFIRFNTTREQADISQCLMHMERAIEFNPRNYKCTFFLALTYARVGMYGEACALVESILTSLPTDAKTLALKAHLAHARAAKQAHQEAEDRAQQPEYETDETTNAAAWPTDESAVRARQLIDESSENPETLGLFAFDSAGALLKSKTRESDAFDFSNCTETVEAMVSACLLNANRLGIGALESCILSGDQWQVVIRNVGSVTVVAFLASEESAATFENAELQLTA
jgi:tetratricopeptide (TPR) repeat protein